MMVDKWCGPEWLSQHNICQERRLQMPGVSHHQGSRTLSGYSQAWVREFLFFLMLTSALSLIILLFFAQSASHGGQECTQFMAYAMAHKGKAMADVSYNPEDPPSAYSNATIHSRLSQYTEMARAVHGPQFDPST
jgi:hypothetical protein